MRAIGIHWWLDLNHWICVRVDCVSLTIRTNWTFSTTAVSLYIWANTAFCLLESEMQYGTKQMLGYCYCFDYSVCSNCQRSSRKAFCRVRSIEHTQKWLLDKNHFKKYFFWMGFIKERLISFNSIKKLQFLLKFNKSLMRIGSFFGPFIFLFP